MKRNNKKKGFTLVELIAVIAILGILAAVIVPRVGGYTDRARYTKEKANAQSILNALEIYNSMATGGNQLDTTTNKDMTLDTISKDADFTAVAPLVGDTQACSDLQATITRVTSSTGSLITSATTLGELQKAVNSSDYSSLKIAITTP